MPERLTQRLRDRFRLTVFSGDTVENFRTCAVVTTHKLTRTTNVVYDKSKLKEYPLSKALAKAHELNHTPLIMEGDILRFASYARYLSRGLPEGTLLHVSAIWIPKENTAWQNIRYDAGNPNQPLLNKSSLELFKRISPLDILESSS